jgi:membrane dipeptidase
MRSCQLTYNHQNWVGSGCKELGNNGLTRFGVEMIEKMNDLGVLIDLSHANMKTMADAIEVSKAPAIISHTGCMDLYKNVRNTTDVNMKKLADEGGIVGICQLRPFLTSKKRDNLDEYFKHMQHAINVAGVEHVCIGSDRDHRVIEDTPEEMAALHQEEGPNFVNDDWPLYMTSLNGPRRMEVVWDGLKKMGLSETDTEKVMGLNLFSLYEKVIG